MMGGRWTVVCKSPVTDGFNSASSGGNFAVMLRRSGFDGVFFRGIAPKPVYLLIDNGEAELRDASDLWGLTTSQTEAALKLQMGSRKFDAAIVSPGGEHLAWTAAIMNDTHRAAARGGPGAVMGSKNLKALVCAGEQKTPVYDPAAVKTVSGAVMDWINNGPISGGPIRAWREFGTNNDFQTNALVGDASVKNWTGSARDDLTMDQLYELTSQNTAPKWKKRKFACASCPIACGGIYEIREERFTAEETGKAEYETVGAFGTQLMCTDPVTVQKCNHLCNEYGLDTISVGATIGWAMECYDKGILTREDLDGIELTWGNAEAIEALTEKICTGEGVGKILMNGSRFAAEQFGKGQECLTLACGMELPQHDSRWSTGMARTYKYDPTPGRHTRGGLGPAFGNNPEEIRFNYGGLGAEDAAGTAASENIDLGGFCCFGGFCLPPTAVVDYLNAVTGFGFSPEEGVDLGKRSFAIRTAFNAREGFIPRRDAALSPRMVGEPPMEKGPLAGVTVDVELLADRFFEHMGYDAATGLPTKAELERLGGMENVIPVLFPD